jgi:hypothetical protein
MKKANRTLKKEMIKNLYEEKGFDMPYLQNLTIKELKCIYDTEFYFEIEW